LYGIKEKLPPSLKVTALSEDGIVMGIQHDTLPFAAVQFHPESILTSPVHGMMILQNALAFLQYNEEGTKEEFASSGAELVALLEKKSDEELRERLEKAGLSTRGSRSELVVRLALFTHKSKEASAGRVRLDDMSVEELSELKQGLGLQGSADTKEELSRLLGNCLVKN
jgi:Glutamine amidotransferase class-I